MTNELEKITTAECYDTSFEWLADEVRTILDRCGVNINEGYDFSEFVQKFGNTNRHLRFSSDCEVDELLYALYEADIVDGCLA